MKDITSRSDLEMLLKKFYERLLLDKRMHHLFIDVAKTDMTAHLPHIVDFWEQSLFNTKSYKKNILQVHLDLHLKESLSKTDFSTWLLHFNTVADELFSGEVTEKLKTRAFSIATILQIKTHNLAV